MKTLTPVSEEAAKALSGLLDCRGCTKCCEQGGVVYVLEQEVNTLRNMKVPLVTIDGISFIQMAQDGSCPMLDRKGKKCSIYGYRPACCRLYPVDGISIAGELQWGLANFCPEDRKCFNAWQGSGSMVRLVSHLSSALQIEDVLFLKRKETRFGYD